MKEVVVRFAPSPTGYLHIGGSRTAIFNWLFARKHGGKFLLRIEDTDMERSNEQAIHGIVEGLRWLGLDWDEGPNFQSQHVGAHLDAAQELLKKDKAYKCFCSKEALEAKREHARRQKMTYQYDGTCRSLTRQQVKNKESEGVPYTIRFKVPRQTGGVLFDDVVYGRIEKKFLDIEDFIIVRGNGQPLYVLSNAVDDIRDGITHVIRGQDGLANTPKQVLIYQGLGVTLPIFAHMSLTLDPKKTKISKRKHGEQVAVHYYREKGFLPWAMVNFLVLLGWATTDSRELFDREGLIQAFNLEGIGRTNSIFNIDADQGKFFTDPKLINMNAHYLRTMRLDSLMPYVKEQLQVADLWDPLFETDKKTWFHETIALIRGRYHTLTDFVRLGCAYFSDEFPTDRAAYAKHLGTEQDVRQWIPDLIDLLEGVAPFDKKTLEGALKAFLKEHGIKPGQLINAVRTAITGQEVGPDVIKVLLCLGKETVMNRLKRVVAAL